MECYSYSVKEALKHIKQGLVSGMPLCCISFFVVAHPFHDYCRNCKYSPWKMWFKFNSKHFYQRIPCIYCGLTKRHTFFPTRRTTAKEDIDTKWIDAFKINREWLKRVKNGEEKFVIKSEFGNFYKKEIEYALKEN